MTKEPNSRSPQPNDNDARRRFWLKLLSRTGIALAVLLLGGITVGAGYLWIFVTNDLAPLVATQLSKTLKRPVQIGRIERFSLTGLRFGPSALPVTPLDTDFAEIGAVEVAFNPFQLILQRTLSLDITLVKAQLYVEQDKQGNWIATQIEQGDSSGPIKIELDAIRFQNARVVAVANPELRAVLLALNKPRPPQRFILQQVTGSAQFRDKQTRVEFDVVGFPISGGNLKISGESILKPLKTNLQIQAQALSAPYIIPLIPNLPLDLTGGKLDCNLGIKLQETQVLSWEGTAGFKDVAGRLGALPQPITKTNGRMRFKGLKVAFEDVSTLYGQIPAQVSGVIDTQADFNLGLKLLPVSAEKFIDTLAIESPVPVTGEVAGDLKLTGPPTRPILSGIVQSTKTTKVDKIDFASASARVVVDSTAGIVTFQEIRAKPAAGGEIIGSGTVPLLPDKQIALNFKISNLPGDAIAEIYSGSPPPVKIGAIAATAKVVGTPTTPNTLVEWQTPEASLSVNPSQNTLTPGSGEIIIVGDTTVFRNTAFQVADGTLTARGSIVKDKWQAFINGEKLQLQPLGAPVPVELSTGEVKLSGTLDSFDLADIQATGRGRLNVGGGQVSLTGNLIKGQWRLSVSSSEIQLQQLGAPVPGTLPRAELNVSGTVEGSTPENIAADATLQLNLGGGTVIGSGSVASGQWQAAIAANQIQLNQLVGNLPVPLQLNKGQLNLSGTVDSFEPANINASTQMQLNVAGAPVSGSGTLRKGQLQASLTTEQTGGIALTQFASNLPVPVQLTQGNVNISGNIDSLDPAALNGNAEVELLVAGGSVSANGTLRKGLFQASLNATGVQVNQFATNLPHNIELANGQVNVSGNLDSLTPADIDANATVALNIAGTPVSGRGTLNSGQFQATLNAQEVGVNQFAPGLRVPVLLAGGFVTVSGSIDSLDPSNINATAEAQLSVAGGIIRGNGTLRDRSLQASVTASNVQINPLAPDLPLPIELADGQVNLSGNLDSLTPADIDANATLALNVAGNRVNGGGTVRNGQFQASLTAQELPLNQFAPNLPPIQLASGNLALSGNLNSLDPADINGTARVQLFVAGGTVNGSGILQNGNLQASVTASGVQAQQLAPDLPVPVELAEGTVNLSANLASLTPADIDANATVALNVAGTPVSGSGTLNSGQFQASLNAQEVGVNQFAPDLPVPVFLAGGFVSLSGNLNSLDPSGIDGTARAQLSVAGGTLDGSGTLRKGDLQASVTARGVQIDRLAPNLPVPIELANGQVNFSGNLNSLTPADINANATVALNVAGTPVSGSGTLNSGQFQASLRATEVSVNQFAPDLQVPVFLAGGFVSLSGNVNSLNPRDMSAIAQAQLNVAGGTVDGNGTLQNGQLQASVRASNVQLNQFAPNLSAPIELADGQVNLSGTLDSFDPSEIDGTGQVLLNVASGSVNARGQLTQGQWLASVRASNVPLNPFAPDLPEPLQLADGNLVLSGSLNSFALADIRADGNVELTRSLGAIASLPTFNTQPSVFSTLLPLTSSFRWNGETLQILEATAPGLNASGLVFIQAQGTQPPVFQGFDLNLQVRGYDLAGLPLPVQSAIANASTSPAPSLIAGLVDFSGRVRGNLAGSTQAPPNGLNLPFDVTLGGDLALRNFAVNGIPFEPLLTGGVQFDTARGVDLQLTGQKDAIALNLRPDFLPASFLVRSDRILLSGGIQGDIFSLLAQNFPLALLNLTPAADVGLGPVAGLFSGSAQFNLATSQGFADIQVLQPSVGYIGRTVGNKCQLSAIGGQSLEPEQTTGNCNQFVGRVNYDNGAIALSNGSLQLGESTYLVEARANTADANLPFDGKITVAPGRAEDVLQALALYTIQDVQRGIFPLNSAPASTVDPVPVGVSQSAGVLNQVRRLSEITALVQQVAVQRQAAGPPELVDVRGAVGGEINFAGSVASGVNLNFNLEGQNLEWRPQRPYQVVTNNQVVLRDNRVININRFVLKGNVENQVLTLLPLRIEIAQGTTGTATAPPPTSPSNAVLSYVGTVGGQNQSGQIRVENLSAEIIRNFVDLPGVELNGLVNLRASLAGSIDKPLARGEVSFVDGALNGDQIPAVAGGFSYANSRLDVSSIAPSSLQINASVPVPPLPGNDQISLDVNIKNEGLTVLNLVSGKQVEWVNGTGLVQFQARGRLNTEESTIEELVATGSATVENATIRAQALPDPLTNVTGKMRFERDRIIVEGIKGDFTQGQVAAQGILPIFASFSPEDPDAANPLAVGLDKLGLNLKGLYRGRVDGRVVITGTALAPQVGGDIKLTNGRVLLPAEPAATAAAAGTPTAQQPGTEFNNLQVTLGDNLQIASPPLLQFVAKGNLTIDGFLETPLPVGTIELLRGQVNLFTTQFTLARGYDQTAEFVGTVDPILNVRLVASVPEVRGSKIASAESSEISDQPALFGSVRTVRIEARVSGPASEISQNLSLTSSPGREESEIIALIGGGFVNTLAQANSPLAIANLAGSALLANVQYAIGNALGLSEFRLSPVLVQSGGSNEIALEAEAGVDVTRNFSVTVVRILREEQNTQYNLRYRVNDKILLRGSSDFQGDSRAEVEYEIRF